MIKNAEFKKADKAAGRKNYANSGKVERSGGEVEETSPEEETIQDWEELEYYQDDANRYDPPTSFLTNLQGVHIFSALWEFVSRFNHGEKEGVTPDVDANKWKMKFSLDMDGAVIDESDNSQKEEISCKVSIHVVEFNTETDEPSLFRVDFERKSGNQQIFNKFYKQAIEEKLYMFVGDDKDED